MEPQCWWSVGGTHSELAGGQKPGQQKHDDLIEKIEEDNRRGDQADGVGGGT